MLFFLFAWFLSAVPASVLAGSCSCNDLTNWKPNKGNIDDFLGCKSMTCNGITMSPLDASIRGGIRGKGFSGNYDAVKAILEKKPELAKESNDFSNYENLKLIRAIQNCCVPDNKNGYGKNQSGEIAKLLIEKDKTVLDFTFFDSVARYQTPLDYVRRWKNSYDEDCLRTDGTRECEKIEKIMLDNGAKTYTELHPSDAPVANGTTEKTKIPLDDGGYTEITVVKDAEENIIETTTRHFDANGNELTDSVDEQTTVPTTTNTTATTDTADPTNINTPASEQQTPVVAPTTQISEMVDDANYTETEQPATTPASETNLNTGNEGKEETPVKEQLTANSIAPTTQTSEMVDDANYTETEQKNQNATTSSPQETTENTSNTKKENKQDNKQPSITPDSETNLNTGDEETDTRNDEQKKKDLDKKQKAYDDAKAKEQSTANRMLGGLTTAATGIGGMQLAQGLAEKSADKNAEQDMAAYIATMRCTYADGKSVKFGTEEIELPGANNAELMKLRNEYFALASDLKERKNALGMKSGIESEEILDRATSGLYDDEFVGIEGGNYASLYRANALNSEADQKQIADEQKKSKNRVIAGGVLAGAGVVGGILGNSLINGKLGEKIKNKNQGKALKAASKIESEALEDMKKCLKDAGVKDTDNLEFKNFYPSVLKFKNINCKNEITKIANQSASTVSAGTIFEDSTDADKVYNKLIESFGPAVTGKMIGFSLPQNPADAQKSSAINTLKINIDAVEKRFKDAAEEDKKNTKDGELSGLFGDFASSIGNIGGDTDSESEGNAIMGFVNGIMSKK